MTTHQPAEHAVNTVTVTCAESGVIKGGSPEGEDISCPTLADIEAWCARVRELGAGGDLMPQDWTGPLTVTLGHT